MKKAGPAVDAAEKAILHMKNSGQDAPESAMTGV